MAHLPFIRVSDEVAQMVVKSIHRTLESGRSNPKVFLTEGDLQSWLFRAIACDLGLGKPDSSLGIHCQIRFLDGEGKLRIEPDLAILNLDEYEVGNEGLGKRKGYHFWGSAVLAEIKCERTCRSLELGEMWDDIRKLGEIRRLHYSNADEAYVCYPIFVLFAHKGIPSGYKEILKRCAEEEEVTVIINDGA